MLVSCNPAIFCYNFEYKRDWSFNTCEVHDVTDSTCVSHVSTLSKIWEFVCVFYTIIPEDISPNIDKYYLYTFSTHDHAGSILFLWFSSSFATTHVVVFLWVCIAEGAWEEE